MFGAGGCPPQRPPERAWRVTRAATGGFRRTRPFAARTLSRSTDRMPRKKYPEDAVPLADDAAAADGAAEGAVGAEPEEEARAPRGSRLDRNMHREEMLDLMTLANRIAKLPQKVRRNLPLDEDAQAQMDLLVNAGLRPERRRILMRAKLLLGLQDLPKLLAALDGDTHAAARDREMVRWRTRIVTGGDSELQSFLEAYPNADRQAIRASARDARGTGTAASRASTRLLQLLRDGAAARSDG